MLTALGNAFHRLFTGQPLGAAPIEAVVAGAGSRRTGVSKRLERIAFYLTQGHQNSPKSWGEF